MIDISKFIPYSFQRMELYQKKQLEVAFVESKNEMSNEEKKEIEERIMSIRRMKN